MKDLHTACSSQKASSPSVLQSTVSLVCPLSSFPDCGDRSTRQGFSVSMGFSPIPSFKSFFLIFFLNFPFTHLLSALCLFHHSFHSYFPSPLNFLDIYFSLISELHREMHILPIFTVNNFFSGIDFYFKVNNDKFYIYVHI